MKVIPVIDILDGIAVHAIKGRRGEYKPLKSLLCSSSDPLDVALAFRACGFDELYVADLDAIMMRRPNFSALKQMVKASGLRLMVDGGIADLGRAKEALKTNVSKVVIGTETLSNLGFIGEAVKALGSERVVVSLDLKGEKVMSRFDLGIFADPLDLLREFQRVGIVQVIVLDLARVGSGEGVNIPFLKEVLKIKETKVFVGGGVRDVKDLVELQNLGVFGILVATALHSGRISLEELRDAGLVRGLRE